MKSLKSALLGSAAAFAAVGAAHAADLPAQKAIPIEYVRICTTYGAGFFYIPGTDTCLRLSGRARFETGYQPTYTRQFNQGGDTTGYQGRMRINMDARTQTGYGTLRAFIRLDAGSRTGSSAVGLSGTQQRIGHAFAALGVDQFGRDQQFMNVDKAFIQFAGLTAGRASSFFDFYAHDFELVGASAGSDVFSTNLLAYTATVGNGLSATLSIEDPIFRRTPIFSPTNNPAGITVNGAIVNFGITNSPAPVFVGYTGATPTRFNQVDVIQRERMPDFVGVLRLDQAWGSAQLSAAVHQLDVNNVSAATSSIGTGPNVSIRHADSVYGWGVQGGVKVNLPSIAAGDAFYLQGAYANGAMIYTGYSAYSGTYSQNAASIQGQKFNQYFADATLNPFTGQLQTSNAFTVVGSFLHYWSPQWRSAFWGSYGEMDYTRSARLNQGAVFNLANPAGTNNFGTNAVGTPGTRFYSLSEALRDTYQITTGASLIWSPVKDLDIGVEGFYVQIGAKNGRVIDKDKDPTAYTAARIASINAGGPVRTATQDSVQQLRFRVQRDF